jgi:hypothetical protein
LGADAVVVCYGLRYSIGQDAALSDADLEPFERNTDHRVVAARRVGLQSYFGKVTDGGEYFLLVGTILGPYGVENHERDQVPDAKLAELMNRTRRLLAEAGLEGEPALHLQLEAQY